MKYRKEKKQENVVDEKSNLFFKIYNHIFYFGTLEEER